MNRIWIKNQTNNICTLLICVLYHILQNIICRENVLHFISIFIIIYIYVYKIWYKII